MKATITITNLELSLIVGVHPQERVAPQKILCTLVIEYDAKKAMKSDNIKSALDYELLSNQIKKETAHTHYQLLESLAEQILKLLTSDRRVRQASVKVEKKHAIPLADGVSVTLSTSHS